VQSASGAAIQVFLNDLHLGQTPLQKTDLKPGTYQLKLTAGDPSEPGYETQVHLYPGTVTSVLWEFTPATEPTGTGDILELEPLASHDRAELSVITVPEGASVRLNNQPYGLSPVIVDSVTAGTYDLTLNAVGHLNKTLSVVIQPGFRLRFFSRLAKDNTDNTASPSATPVSTPTTSTPTSAAVTPKPSTVPTVKPSPTPSLPPGTSIINTPVTKPYVEIKDTGTGWLRVHSDPQAGAGNEVGKVSVGAQYPYRSMMDGWYEIEYSAGKTGWISGQYGLLVQ
jgi:hypothetical protein